MFKALLLGQWPNLSEVGLKDALRVRLDFKLLCGFELHDAVPDAMPLSYSFSQSKEARQLIT
jgi:IS5 family transposase